MHLKDNTLRAFLDNELPAHVHKNAADHLAGCSKCTARLAHQQAIAGQVGQCLDLLVRQTSLPARSTVQALETIYQRKEDPMSKIFRRPVWVPVALALVLAFAFIFPPVRALAGNFLGLFRVQQVQVISFDPVAMERYNNPQNNDLINNFFNQNTTTRVNGEYREVATKEEAAALAGFAPRLPAGAKISSLGVTPAETLEINIDSASMNAGLEAFGYPNVTIPSDLDGQKIVASIPFGITTALGDCEPQETSGRPDGCVVFVQMPSPTITAPDSFPIIQVGEVIFQLMGMSPEQAAQVSQNIDWTTTLVLPIPIGEGIETWDVPIDGVNGTLINNPKGESALIWVKDSVIYVLSGMNGTAGMRLVETLE